MDFLASAQVLVPALCGLNAAVFGAGDEPRLAAFETRFVFSPQVQPLFTAEGLRRFFAERGADRIFWLRDALDIQAVLFKVDKQWAVLGPYVDVPWNEGQARVRLAVHALGDAALLPYKAYRCSLPVLSSEYVIKVAALLLTNTVGNPPREVELIDLAAQTAENMALQISEEYGDPAQVDRRYAWEDELMEAVRQGQTARALAGFEKQASFMTGIRFLSDNITDQIAGAFAMRVLVRRAALQAGLTPVFVDALSQEYAQQMHRAVDGRQLSDLMHQYLAAFCRAVRENRRTGYSPRVRQAVQYIELHVSSPLTVAQLCALTGVTRQRLGALFRAETGRTVKGYIQHRRCECAAELLRDSRLQVQEIARYVGYEDTGYFARVFKAETGRTPQEYRKEASVS